MALYLEGCIVTLFIRQPTMIFIVAMITLSYTWVYFFYSHDFIRSAGIFTLQIIGLLVGLVWVLKTYKSLKKQNDKDSSFWLFLGIGIIFCALSWLNLANHTFFFNRPAPYPGFTDYYWFLAYISWIIALIYKLVSYVKKTEIIPLLFDVSIFMLTAIALIWEFLISNIFLNLSGNFLTDAVGITYPVMDLTLLFVTILVFFTTRNNYNKNIFTIISIGFIFQIIADFIYVHQSLNGTYVLGGWIDPLWNITVLLKGAAGLYGQKI
jgi:diguanylate cyclase